MFIGYYKSVVSANEFYSSKKSDLNFPAQVEFNGERFLLNKTIQVSSNNLEKSIISSAEKNNIPYGIKID